MAIRTIFATTTATIAIATMSPIPYYCHGNSCNSNNRDNRILYTHNQQFIYFRIL